MLADGRWGVPVPQLFLLFLLHQLHALPAPLYSQWLPQQSVGADSSSGQDGLRVGLGGLQCGLGR